MKKKWWHEKIGYQIYPKSFLDTNGDGVGDLKGVIEKLPYLEQLGVDILWLSPVYPSPMVDNGYDISDYGNIDPRFGTLEDMDRLIAEAKKKNISIIMDLVVNHCSDQHAWFQKAIADPKGPYGDYFYLKEGKDGKEPNNWRSYFGGSVWEKLPGQENLYYYHAYAKEQPDLNWENPALREEIYKMVNWWLDRGRLHANSTTSLSSIGTRLSSETAIAVRSTFTRISSGWYISRSISIRLCCTSTRYPLS